MTEQRIDYININDKDFKDGLVEPFKIDENGHLVGRAIATSIGVFPYSDGRGNLVWEARKAEDVFDPESLKSFTNLPITNDHPDGPVNDSNVSLLEVGRTGTEVKHSDVYMSLPLKITDSKAIDDVQSGKRALSNGYSADVINESGNYLGMPYTRRQTNIRGNHTAIVDKGRAGDDAVMKFDSAAYEEMLKNKNNINDKNDSEEKIKQEKIKMSESKNFKTIKIDGIDLEGELELLKSYNKIKKDNESLKNDFAEKENDYKKENETLHAKLDAATEENEKLKADKGNSEKFDKAVIEKVKLLTVANQAGIEGDLLNMDSLDVKKEVIRKVSPEAMTKIDSGEKGESYIDARFDIAIEIMEKNKKDKRDQSNALKNDSIKNSEEVKNDNENVDLYDAFDGLHKRILNGGKE